MVQVLIRNLSDEVVEAHRRRVNSLGHSLEHKLGGLIESAAAHTTDEKLAVAEWSQSLTQPCAQTDAAILIREDRDR